MELQPGSGGNSGGIESWDHDNDAGTPSKTLVPGIDSLFESPDANDVFDHSTFLPESIDPDDITNIAMQSLNPCATAVCTAEETAAGKDNLLDVIVTTTNGGASYTILNDPSNPGSFQTPTAIGSEEFDDRDVKIADINLDGVPDLLVVSFDAPNRVYYGDPTRPGDYSSTMHDTFGEAGDGSIGVEVVDLDDDATTPPDIIVANAATFDHVYLGSETLGAPSGSGTGLFDEKYTKVDIPSTETSTTTDVDIAKGLGTDASTSFIAVFTNSDGVDQIMEIDASLKTSLLDGTRTLSAADVFVLDSSLSGENTQSVKVSDVTGDGIADVVVIFNQSPNGVAGYVYPGIENTLLSTDLFAGTKIPIGSSAVSGVEMTIEGSTIQIIDEHGGVHYYANSGTNTWPSALYPDPNLPEGTTVAATKPHDHQDSDGAIETGDFDSDGFFDVISGNQLFLSSLAVTKGDFSDVTPINFDHNAAPLAVLALDADSDTDSDLFVVPGPSGNTGDPSTGGEAPYIILNRGDGNLKHSEKAILSGLTPPSGSWSGTSIETITKYTDSSNVDHIVIAFNDATSDMMVIPIPGAGTKAEWEAITMASVTTIPSTSTKRTKQLMTADLDGSGTDQLLHLHDTGLDIMTTADNGLTWTIEKNLAVEAGPTSFGVGNLDTSGTTGVRRGLDIVVAAGDVLTIHYADDFPVATGESDPLLSEWGTSSTTILHPHAASSDIEKILIFDEDQNGIDDILFTTDTGGRYIYRVTEAAAEQRQIFLVENNPTDLTLSDETEAILAILKVDTRNIGVTDLIYAYADGRTKLVLAEVAARSDLANVDIISHLATEMNPTNTPSELLCRENPGDGTCVASTDGAWIDTGSNVGGDVSQWGNGHIDPTQQTTTVGSRVDATDPSVSDHGPPCALPGSQVVPVETTFYIDFPVVNLITSSNPNPPRYVIQ